MSGNEGIVVVRSVVVVVVFGSVHHVFLEEVVDGVEVVVMDRVDVVVVDEVEAVVVVVPFKSQAATTRIIVINISITMIRFMQ